MRSLLALVLLVGAAQAAEPPRLTLKQAIDRALTQNPRVLTQVQELARAQAQVTQVRAGALPSLTANGLYTHTPITASANGELFAAPDNVTANLTASVPLVAPQRWVQLSQQKGNARVAALAVGDVRRQVAMSVAQAFLQILTRRREVELDQRARDTARAHAAYTHTRLAGGVGSRLDDVRAQQELQTDEQLVVSATLALERARETLGLLVAAPGPVDAGDEPWLQPVDAGQALAEAPRLRPDLVAVDARRRLADRIVHESWADYMPSLTATFSGPIYNWPATVFTPSWSWQFQLALTVPLYDGGLRYGLLRERRAISREARIDQDTALRQLRSDLRFDDEAVRRTEEALGRARQAAKLAHEAVQIADLADHAGATTNLELIDAERRARDADTAAAIAEDAARQARLDLLFAAGRLP